MRRSLFVPGVALGLLHSFAPLRAQDSIEREAVRLEEYHAQIHGTAGGWRVIGERNRSVDGREQYPLVFARRNEYWQDVSHRNTPNGAVAATAPEARTIARIGMLGDHEYFGNPISPVDWVAAFRAGLRDAGYVEGRNVLLEFRNGDSDPAKLARAAADLVAIHVDVIVASSTTAAKAAKAATRSIPIVFWSAEPVSSGLVANLDHPGANLTGLTANEEQQARFLAVLKEVVPGLRTVAILFNPSYAPVPGLLEYAERGARTLGLAVHRVEVKEPGDLPHAFAAMKCGRIRAALVLNHGMFYRERAQLATLAIENNVALSSPYFPNAAAGALIAHEPDFDQVWRLNAGSVARILKGAKPGDLPVRRLVALRYAVNLKTARMLGLTTPRSVLSGAALVIADSTAQRDGQDSLDVRATLARTVEAYDRRDAGAIAAEYTDDADHIRGQRRCRR